MNSTISIEHDVDRPIAADQSKSVSTDVSNQKGLYDRVCADVCKLFTKSYSTSFSLGILCLDSSIRVPIYQIYGFVRLADEIVDTMHDYDKELLLNEFEIDLYHAIDRRISTNPVLNSFQEAFHRYNIDKALVEAFMHSMRMDLEMRTYDTESYKEYIYGSAEVVGLMCLYVFVNGDEAEYQRLKTPARTLGSAFQKINFLRDLNADAIHLGRIYFPNVEIQEFDNHTKNILLSEIKHEFDEALLGIKQLPKNAQFGVYVAYKYYLELYRLINIMPAEQLLKQRASVSNLRKLWVTLKAYLRYKMNAL